MIEGRILDLAVDGDAAIYAEALDHFPATDVQHSVTFVRTAALAESGSAHALLCRRGPEALAYPFVLRDLRRHPHFSQCLPGRRLADATTPFEYGGILAATPDSWHQLGEAGLAVLDGFFAEHCVISEFLRFNPFLPIPAGLESRYEIRQIHDSVYIDTTRDAEQIVAAADRSVRKNLRRAREECGLDFRQVDPGPEEIKTFIDLYHGTMTRTQAKPYYFFSPAYYQAVLADRRHASLFQIHDAENAVLASSIVVHGGTVAHHFLTGSDEQALLKRPNDLMLIGLSGWCHQNGLAKLHLGGGPPGIRSYKQRFSDCSAPYHIGHRVVDAEAYAALTRHRFGDAPPGAFRPAYREGL